MIVIARRVIGPETKASRKSNTSGNTQSSSVILDKLHKDVYVMWAELAASCGQWHECLLCITCIMVKCRNVNCQTRNWKIIENNVIVICRVKSPVIQFGEAAATHDDAIKWKHFPRYWPFVRGIHRSQVNKGQWRGAFIVSLICARINGWVNNGDACDLRRHRAHYDITVITSMLHGYMFVSECWRVKDHPSYDYLNLSEEISIYNSITFCILILYSPSF